MYNVFHFSQCTVEVTDGGYPTPKTTTTNVIISVARGVRPTFTQSQYDASIKETDPVTTSVVTVQASRVPPPIPPVCMPPNK